jgi:hypothetical protein
MTQRRTMQETRTSLTPADVLEAANEFFVRRNTLYAAFTERLGQSHITLRGQGGEEIVVAARVHEGATQVTASSYLFDAQISRFFSVLPPAPDPVLLPPPVQSTTEAAV